MSLTLTKLDEDVWGKTRVLTYKIKLDNSYPTNGYKASLGFSASKFGLQTILGVHVIGIDGGASGVVAVVFDYTNVALMAFRSNVAAHSHDLLLKDAAVADGATTRVNAGANLLGANTGGDLTVAGGGANGGVQASVAAGASMVEVSNTTNLSAVTVRVQVFGKA